MASNQTQSQNTNQKIRIGIIGGGPAGLTSALALEAYVNNSSVEVVLFDKNKSVIDYPGVEYGIQERACRALDRIGIKERALRRGVRAHRIEFFNSRLQRQFRSIKSDPDNTRCVVRQEFLTDLEDLVSDADIRMQHKVVKVSQSSQNNVVLEIDRSDGSKLTEEFDVVIACDGSFSTVRRQFFPESADKIDQGFSCIYMLLEPSEPAAADERYLRLANGGTSQLMMGRNSTLTLFPLGANRLAYGIGFDHATKQRLWADNELSYDTDWTEVSSETRKSIATALTEDACPHDSLYSQSLSYVSDWESYKIYLWKMQDTDALDDPYIRGRNVVLIGDAAHALMPTIGMGASLAIEDAERLARRIADCINMTASAEAFREGFTKSVAEPYSEVRAPIWTELIRRARLAAKENFINQSERKRFAIGPAIPNDTLSRIVSAIESMARKIGV
ncbi:MAG: NAD(P)/FAD-dependent oxidoreductase [Pseudomonadota bacterium]